MNDCKDALIALFENSMSAVEKRRLCSPPLITSFHHAPLPSFGGWGIGLKAYGASTGCPCNFGGTGGGCLNGKTAGVSDWPGLTNGTLLCKSGVRYNITYVSWYFFDDQHIANSQNKVVATEAPLGKTSMGGPGGSTLQTNLLNIIVVQVSFNLLSIQTSKQSFITTNDW